MYTKISWAEAEWLPDTMWDDEYKGNMAASKWFVFQEYVPTNCNNSVFLQDVKEVRDKMIIISESETVCWDQNICVGFWETLKTLTEENTILKASRSAINR